MQQSDPEFIPTNFSIPLYSIFLSSAGFLFSHVWLNLRIYLAALRDRSISENNGDRTPRYKTDLHFVNGAAGTQK